MGGYQNNKQNMFGFSYIFFAVYSALPKMSACGHFLHINQTQTVEEPTSNCRGLKRARTGVAGPKQDMVKLGDGLFPGRFAVFHNRIK